MTNFEWIKGMDAEQMARDIIAPCDQYDCWRCPIESVCARNENAMEWLREEHEGDKG